MANKTLAVTPGSGAVVNTLPDVGQGTMANSLPVALASDQSPLPVTLASQPLPSGAATEVTLAAVKTALLAQIDLADLIVTDNTGSFYVRRESVNEGTGAVTVTFTTLAGAAASPNTGSLAPANGSSSTRVVETALFDAVASGTGYAGGDVIARVLVYDTAANSVVASYWHDLTSGAAIASAPAAANLQEQARTLPIGAATAIKQPAPGVAGTPSADVITVQGILGGVAQPADTVVQAAPTTRSNTITAGGTAQTLAPAKANRRGFVIQNQSSGPLYWNAIGTATVDQNSMLLNAGDYYESPPHHVGPGAISIIGATTGQAFYAREF